MELDFLVYSELIAYIYGVVSGAIIGAIGMLLLLAKATK